MNYCFAPLGYAAIPRSSIESFRYASIDVSLKDLRNVSRRVTAFSTPYQNELQVLERIYYKGKNQHRSALFWRKVLEIRRFGTRINEIKISAFVQDLRYVFYRTEDRSNSKVLRGAWTQAPDSTSCVSLLRRLRSVCFLVDQTRTRFRSAHKAFAQQIRTATFIPLAVCLVSITSRLDFLLSELRDILALLWQAVTRILDTIAGPETNRRHNVLLPLNPFGLTAAVGTNKIERAHKRARVNTDLTEDFGSKVSRESHTVTSASHICETPCIIAQMPLTGVEPSTTAHSGGFTVTSSSHSISSVSLLPTLPVVPNEGPDVTTVSSHVRRMPPTESPLIRPSPGEVERDNSKQGVAGKRRKVNKVKKVKKPDEIDNIFGF